MKTLKIFALFLLLATLPSCENEKEDLSDVNSTTVISPELYDKQDDAKTIIEAKIAGDMLVVIIGASGCDGATWKAHLTDKGVVAESNPVQRFAKIKFENKEDCAAVISKTFTFDIKPLRVKGVNKVFINLDGWKKGLLYEY